MLLKDWTNSVSKAGDSSWIGKWVFIARERKVAGYTYIDLSCRDIGLKKKDEYRGRRFQDRERYALFIFG